MGERPKTNESGRSTSRRLARTTPQPKPTGLHLLPDRLLKSPSERVKVLRAAFFAALMGDVTLADSSGTGTLEIVGNTWTFKNYSPDGLVIINGPLTVMMDTLPIDISGELVLTGSQEGTVVVDIAVTLLLGQDPPMAATGSITFDGEVYDVAELMAGESDEGE